MSDIKDIMGVGKGSGAEKAEPAPKPKKQKIERPKGMSREAFALLGDQHPLISSQLVQPQKEKDLKAKPKPSAKGIPTWSFKEFKNSARTDGLELRRWTKDYKDAQGRIKLSEDTDYAFAKYNKKVQLLRYNDEEWEALLKNDNSGWSREETDYLLDLCERFDLRFVVIADRYEYTPTARSTVAVPRGLDDLKERYYAVARKLLIAREGGQAPVANHILVKYPFSKAHEIERKKAIELMLARTPQQLAEENAILAEAKSIEEKRKAEAAAAAVAARRAAAQPPPMAAGIVAAATPSGAPPPTITSYPDHFPNNPGPGVPSLFAANMEPFKAKPGAYARGMSTSTLGTQIANSVQGGQRGQKAWEGLMAELAAVYPGVTAPPRHATRSVCGTWLALRNEMLALHELRRLRNPGTAAADDKKSSKKRQR